MCEQIRQKRCKKQKKEKFLSCKPLVMGRARPSPSFETESRAQAGPELRPFWKSRARALTSHYFTPWRAPIFWALLKKSSLWAWIEPGLFWKWQAWAPGRVRAKPRLEPITISHKFFPTNNSSKVFSSHQSFQNVIYHEDAITYKWHPKTI